MQRKNLAFLKQWLGAKDRRPLVIRGARQVGKTWLVRYFAEVEGRQLIELNFEKTPQRASLFESNEPQKISQNLESALNIKLNPEKCILFLDEIQAAPELLAKLRWFAEDLPELPVITAGSLLEFVLETHSFSMPVGRISYLHMEPLSFEEFLMAKNNQGLLNYLQSYKWETKIPVDIHEQFISNFKEYLIVGGMPAAVSSWVREASPLNLRQVHGDLMASYRDDFAKYRGSLDKELLDEVMMAAPEHLGKKFIYSKVNPDVQSRNVKQALNLLCKARICHKVRSCFANGVPLAAELNKNYFKVLFLDVGLCSAALRLSLDKITKIEEIALINSGGIAEQVVGQLLRTVEPPFVKPELYYWTREGSDAEVDFILQQGNTVVPLEVKAGKIGSLKSLHIFMRIKGLACALRINSDYPSITPVDVKDSQGNEVRYTLYSLPFYLLGQVLRLIPH